MSALVITILRFGFLALLWIFVLFVVVTIRNDVFGTRINDRAGRARPVKQESRRRVAPAPVPAGPTRLVVTEGPLSGTTLPLGVGSLTVGRSPDSALVLDDGYASSRHARFYNDAGTWFIEDLNSTNGTWVGTQRIYQPIQLDPGMPVTIGKTTMEIRR